MKNTNNKNTFGRIVLIVGIIVFVYGFFIEMPQEAYPLHWIILGIVGFAILCLITLTDIVFNKSLCKVGKD